MKFCMVVDLDNTYRGRMMMMMKMMMMLNIMMKINIANTGPIFKSGGPDFAW